MYTHRGFLISVFPSYLTDYQNFCLLGENNFYILCISIRYTNLKSCMTEGMEFGTNLTTLNYQNKWEIWEREYVSK